MVRATTTRKSDENENGHQQRGQSMGMEEGRERIEEGRETKIHE